MKLGEQGMKNDNCLAFLMSLLIIV